MGGVEARHACREMRMHADAGAGRDRCWSAGLIQMPTTSRPTSVDKVIAVDQRDRPDDRVDNVS